MLSVPVYPDAIPWGDTLAADKERTAFHTTLSAIRTTALWECS